METAKASKGEKQANQNFPAELDNLLGQCLSDFQFRLHVLYQQTGHPQRSDSVHQIQRRQLTEHQNIALLCKIFQGHWCVIIYKSHSAPENLPVVVHEMAFVPQQNIHPDFLFQIRWVMIIVNRSPIRSLQQKLASLPLMKALLPVPHLTYLASQEEHCSLVINVIQRCTEERCPSRIQTVTSKARMAVTCILFS